MAAFAFQPDAAMQCTSERRALQHQRTGAVDFKTHEFQKLGADDTARRFIDMHDIGDMLVAAGFADPVMDMEIVNFTYRHPRQFLADQRHLGVRDAFLGRQSFRTWRKVFSAWPRNHEEHWSLRFEVVYGHAWKPAPRLTSQAHPKRDAAGNAIVTFHSR